MQQNTQPNNLITQFANEEKKLSYHSSYNLNFSQQNSNKNNLKKKIMWAVCGTKEINGG